MSRSLRSEKIPTNIIILYAESGCLPLCYSAVNSVNCKFLRGVNTGVCPGTCFGASTHTHTAFCHTHTICPTTAGSHTHPGSVSGLTVQVLGGGGSGQGGGMTDHTHPITLAATNSGTFSAAPFSHTHDAISNNPSYKTVRHIKYTGTLISLRKRSLPLYGLLMYPRTNAIQLPFIGDTRYDCFHGRGSSLSGCTGGSNTHLHSSAGTCHVHFITTSGHTHTVSTINPAGGGSVGTSPLVNTVTGTHTHPVGTYATGSSPTGGSNSNATGSHAHCTINHEPPYLIARMIKYNSLNPRVVGILNEVLVEWECTLATIPTGFQLADGTNNTVDARLKFIKFKASCIGTTGGSSTHTLSCSGNHTHATGNVLHKHPITGATGTTPLGAFSAPPGSIHVKCLSHSHGTGLTADQSTSVTLNTTGAHTHGAQCHLPVSKEIAFIERLK